MDICAIIKANPFGLRKGAISMDIKDTIKTEVEKIVKKLLADSKLKDLFNKDPINTLKTKFNLASLGEDQLKSIVTAVKAKLTADNLGDAAGKLGGLFGKK